MWDMIFICTLNEMASDDIIEPAIDKGIYVEQL